MGITVLVPDVNESGMNFTVNAHGALRFGMGGIKGVGSAAIEMVVQERTLNGPYKSVFDFVERVNLSMLNRKTMENLVYAGAFDSFETIRRADFFMVSGKDEIFLDQLLRYGSKMQLDKESKVNSLFDMHHAVPAVRPEAIRATGYSELALLNKERELVGIYLSAHPLDGYAFEIKHFVTHTLPDAVELLKDASARSKVSDKDVCLAGLVTSVKKAVTKKTGKPWAAFTIEDFKGSISFSLFGKDYENFMNYLDPGLSIFIRCQPQPRFGDNNNEWEFKVKNITMLANVKDELVKQVCLTLPTGIITSDFRKELTAALTEHSGTIRLNIKIVDQVNQIAVDFFSRSFRISMNPGFVAFLEQKGIAYSL
jgi:DNA polymerase-3 subunit alpha